MTVPLPRSPLSVTLLAATATLTATACGPGAEEREAAVRAAEREAAAVVESRIDSADAVLSGLPGLTADLRGELRKHLNPRQVATARQLGVDPVRDSAQVAALVERGELVRLQDTTDHWVVRELDHSVPYVTPDTRGMLVELGQRFHSALDSLGLPPFRFEVTSVLRTHAMQARLRQGNSNASRTTSSHEFGTTVDIAYNRFAAPAGAAGREEPSLVEVEPADSLDLSRAERDRVAERVAALERQRLADLAEDRAAELKGVLGAVLADMQDQARVQPLVERSQPVFHMTVASRYPRNGEAEEGRASVAE